LLTDSCNNQNHEESAAPDQHSESPHLTDRVFNAIPPPGLVLLAIIAIQIGAALATQLFSVLGASGTVAMRIIISALLLGIAARSGIASLTRVYLQHWPMLTAFGLCIAAMNLFFYESIARIPLGAAVAFEFIGPLGVAAFTSRRFSHFAWVALAALGIVLLSPLAGLNFDTVGVCFALLAGAGWAFFIILAGRVGKKISGTDGLAIGMVVAAVTMIPFAVPVIDEVLFNPPVLLAALGVAMLSTTIPFTLEFEALKRVSPNVYGILVSLEPAVAALVGAWLLGERIGLQGSLAVGCVVVAAVGITMSEKSD
jgi:inner membrane transporter RhtA